MTNHEPRCATCDRTIPIGASHCVFPVFTRKDESEVDTPAHVREGVETIAQLYVCGTCVDEVLKKEWDRKKERGRS